MFGKRGGQRAARMTFSEIENSDFAADMCLISRKGQPTNRPHELFGIAPELKKTATSFQICRFSGRGGQRMNRI